MNDNLNLGEMINKLQDVASSVKNEGANQVFTTTVGGGMVKISANGNNEVLDLHIDDSLLEDKDSLKILLISGINDILKQSEEFKKTIAMKALGGLDLGNIFSKKG